MRLTILAALRKLDEPRHRAQLYGAWSAELGAGLEHHVSLEQMGPVPSALAEEVRRYLIIGTQQGRSVAALVKARPKLFAPFEAAMLSAGDTSGTLDASLRLLAEYFSCEYRRMLRVRDRMGYPLVLALMGAFALPLPVLNRSGWRAYLAGVGVTLLAVWLLGGILISLVAGVLANSSALTRARFARALVIGLQAGLPRGRTIRLAADASGNAELRRHVARRTEHELGSKPLAESFEGCAAVPGALLGQMRVADATGDYLHTLRMYADELETRR